MLKFAKSAYGGSLRKTRAGRAGARPLSTRESMHLVLRSSRAKGDWSFLRPRNSIRVKAIIEKFAFIYGVQILSLVNVGNHLHLHIRLGNRFGYAPFIRAISGAIVVAVCGHARWSKKMSLGTHGEARGVAALAAGDVGAALAAGRFWDHRPFTRVVVGFQAARRMVDYLRINEMEGWGFSKTEARGMFDIERKLKLGIPTWGAG